MGKTEKIVMEKIIKLIEENNTLPWEKSWNTICAPFNGATGREYTGFNALILNWIGASNGYSIPAWFTFKQAQNLFGTIKRGEKALPIIFWKPSYYDLENKKFIQDKEIKKHSQEEIDRFIDEDKWSIQFFMRYYNVFNFEQINFPEKIHKKLMDKVNSNRKDTAPNQEIDSIIFHFQNAPKVKFGNFNPCYSPAKHEVYIPDIGNFENQESYYRVLFHEMIHSTGHESILNRNLDCLFGTHDYSFEELIAEFGACFLASHFGIDDSKKEKQSADYIKKWLEKLKTDSSILFKASSKAQKAVQWILEKQPCKK